MIQDTVAIRKLPRKLELVGTHAKKKLEMIRIPGRFVRTSPGCFVSRINEVTSGDIWEIMISNDQKTSTFNVQFGLITACITQFGTEFPNRDSR